MKSSKSSVEAQFGPLQKKTFASALSLFFEQQCPQMGGHLTRQVLVNTIRKLVDEFYPANTHLRMGQIMWPAVDEKEHAAYGKSMQKTRIKPVFVDMIAPEDIEAAFKGEKRRRIRQQATVRLFHQAKEQGGVLTEVDVATMMRLSPATISNYVRNWEKEHQTLVPRRGTIHDMGRSVTHKRQICHKMIVEGKSVEETARETNHSPEAITRYVKDYKRILACLHKGLTPKDTAFVAKVSENLVYEYVNLIQENQVAIKEQMGKDRNIFNDIPF
jgi:DNA-binding CsgD family transcriptional regulator